MKRLALTPLICAATLFLPRFVQAEERKANAGAPPAPTGAMNSARADEILKRFDKNGDGKLDDEERADAHDAMLQEQMNREAARVAAPGADQFRGRMLEMFDKNHDGRLDEEERAEAQKYAVDRGLPAMIEDLTKRFDKNGDGKLDDQERAAMEKYMEEFRGRGGRPAIVRDQLMQRFDRNADGKIDQGELAELEKFIRPRIESNPVQVQHYDRNGDGRIDESEWKAARQEIASWLNTGDVAPFFARLPTKADEEKAHLDRVSEEMSRRRAERQKSAESATPAKP